ncbi:MAG: DUF420 domain-containing protein [Blastocatellia bacterium]|nr:DUF420 domain-containing protein [Blastocatellia bacterium]
MDLLHIFPHLNAALNATACVFLIAGFVFIMRRQVARHRACMLTASIVSAVFLASYLAHHAVRTYYFGLGPTRFTHTGFIRPVYFTILTSHTILAAGVGPFILLTLYRGLKEQFDKHRNIARLVYPIWLYVSITGVAVYLILYQIFPPAAAQ